MQLMDMVSSFQISVACLCCLLVHTNIIEDIFCNILTLSFLQSSEELSALGSGKNRRINSLKIRYIIATNRATKVSLYDWNRQTTFRIRL